MVLAVVNVPYGREKLGGGAVVLKIEDKIPHI